MKEHRLLILLPELFAICRRLPGEPIPGWATTGSLFSITRSGDELSIVCPEKNVPSGEKAERGWRAMRFADTLDFVEAGILSNLATPLAGAGISIFVVSTYDTDYLLVKETELRHTVSTLTGVGYEVGSQ